MDPVKLFGNGLSLLRSSMTISLPHFRGIEGISLSHWRGTEGFELEDKPWDSALPPSMELDGQGNLLSEEQDSGPTKLLSKKLDDLVTYLHRVRSTLFEMWQKRRVEPKLANDAFWMIKYHIFMMTPNITFMTRRHSDFAINDTQMSDLQVKIRKILGFVLVVLFIYQYLMGFVERGQWNTYSSGAWEFRATYVCIELRLGSYPFQKFRVTPRKYSGVTMRTYDTKNGVIYKYEPWVRFKKDKFYFQGQTSALRAARICDVAKFCLKIKGRKGYNFAEEQYTYLSSVQEFLPQQSDNDIKRLVLEYAKPFLNEVEVSEVPIADQPPCVEPARFANGEDNTIQGLSAYVDMLQAILLDDTNEQTADMIEEPQSVSRNPDIAGPTLEKNVGEGQGVFASSVDPSLDQPRCTSKFTLMAPCNCIANISDVEVFQREKWQVAAFKFAASNMSRRCELEGCSEIMHDRICLQKSGNAQELFWSDDMWAAFNHLKKHGWKEVAF
ncbi:unnamed protein product [Sphagnum tenellum]